MPDYQKMYSTLFNAITDAIECIQRRNSAMAEVILIQAQQKTEKIYISAEELCGRTESSAPTENTKRFW